MAEMTVSKALEYLKAWKERRNELKELVKENSTERRWYNAGNEKVETPRYDASAVDALSMKLHRAIRDLSAELKQSNAVTKVQLDINLEELEQALPMIQTSTQSTKPLRPWTAGGTGDVPPGALR